jgi:hypothetical protein
MINKLSPHKAVSGNFNSLMSQEDSLFFLSFDGSLLRAKRGELCGMPCGAVGESEQKLPNFPVIFPVSRELGLESGSLETPSTAIESI